MANPHPASPSAGEPSSSASPDTEPPATTAARAGGLGERFTRVREWTEALCAALDPEDCVAQSMSDTSPTKWHLAHTTWFFETFVLAPHAPDHEPFHPTYGYLFNSYYNGAGDRHARPARGLLTRPSLEEVFAYRARVDEQVQALLHDARSASADEVRRVVEIGLHHEQQHQELILTDLKHLFAQNALAPAYRPPLDGTQATPESLGWHRVAEGVYRLGHDGDGFAFDNELPAHRVYLESFELADRLVTNAEYRDFVEDGGYRRPDLWLDVGWATVQREGWTAPIYWRGGPGDWREFTLAGERELCRAEPVSHVSFIEAAAFARWAGARLPTEAEWEVACGARPVQGNFVESGRLHPQIADKADADGLRQLFGDCWEWTRSSYAPYPGYRPAEGTLGEYNGKFMCDQLVLRGGSCASAASHLRASYRNFFYAPDRWQFSGIRLAKEPS